MAAPRLHPRDELRRAAADRGEALTALSRMIGRGESYLGRFVNEGTPAELAAADIAALCDYLELPRRWLGGVDERPRAAVDAGQLRPGIRALSSRYGGRHADG